jgi:hypothetical protein
LVVKVRRFYPGDRYRRIKKIKDSTIWHKQWRCEPISLNTINKADIDGNTSVKRTEVTTLKFQKSTFTKSIRFHSVHGTAARMMVPLFDFRKPEQHNLPVEQS